MNTFKCPSCRKSQPENGSAVRCYLGKNLRLCAGCKLTHQRSLNINSHKAKVRNPSRTLGQRTFSAGGVVPISNIKGYPGRDVRYTADESFEGEYMREWKRLTGTP